jgi:hypothetical protein
VSVEVTGVGVVGVGASLQAPASAAVAQSRIPQAIRRNISSPNPMVNFAVGSWPFSQALCTMPGMYRRLDFQWPESV